MLNKIRNKKWVLIQFYIDENDEEIRKKENVYYFNLNNLRRQKNSLSLQHTNINLQKFFNKCISIYQKEFN